LFYIRKTAEQGWSRDMMVHQIEGKLHEREGALSNNFIRTIPDYESDLTRQLFKDPYQFDFIMLGEAAKERDLEEALMNQITKFLLELGDGVAFMGRQKRFETGGKEFYVDLLFYHTKLRRHIIIDLKIREFEPEFVSKMNVYLGLADDQIKGHQDRPSIGIILCKTKNKIIAEYALRDTSKPIGIAEYKIAQQLPPDIKGELPSIEELERELEEEVIKMQKPIEKKMQRIKELANALRTEEVKEKNTKENGLKIFNKVFLPLKKLLMTKLSEEISSWFEDTQVSMQIADRGFKTDTESRKEIKKLTYCPHEMKLSINLRGFKKAGAKAFSSWRDFIIRLSEYNYIITIANLQGYSLEKLYHKVLSKVEQAEVVEKFCEAVADDITAQLERLQKEKR
jgi:predicted nuclease of restriction endonuclease-like (RecB) superfamily